MRRRTIRRTLGASLLCATAVVVGAQPSVAMPITGPEAATTATSPATSPAGARDVVLKLTFGASTGTVRSPHVSGLAASAVESSVVARAGGRVEAVTGPAGSALSFPSYAVLADTTPLAVVRLALDPAATADPLDPGGRSFTWGADFSVDNDTGDDDTDGDNLVQRGLTPDVLWKLQVDHHAVTCGLRSTSMATTVYTPAVAIGSQDETSLQTRTWYRATCTRDATGSLVLVVKRRTGSGSFETVARRQTAAGTATGRMTMSRSTPVSVGGKLNVAGTGLNTQPDQFNGLVDNVKLVIG